MKTDAILQAWEAATLSNDFIFSKVFLEPAITKELLHRALPELQIKRLNILHSQHEIASTADVKNARLDVYAQDQYGDHYDIEMQVTDHHNLPQRNRFYQAVLANSDYEKGANYNQAHHTYVIFFCLFDPFNLGQQRYEIRRRIVEQPEYLIDDGEESIFFNLVSLRHEVRPKLQHFIDYLAG